MISLLSPADALRPTAIALGSFDGLHRGHRSIIAAVSGAVSGHPEAVPTVVSFWPHPREVLRGERRLRLDLPEEKLALLEPLGIRQLVMLPFDAALAALSPEAFVEQVLAGQLQARQVAVGADFRFGAGRRGDADSLVRLGAALGIEIMVLPLLCEGGERASSSRIRRALAAGGIDTATRLLGRPYRFSGRVVSGRGLGHQLGWPTANLQVDGRKFLPAEGVYAARVWIGGPLQAAAAAAVALPAVMNLGPQPTVDPGAPSAVEVHLLDRQLELSDALLTVEPVQLLRRQQRFGGLEELVAQIGRDAGQARALLASTTLEAGS
ncbi:MAG: bifunctional riboflavin kinase/FAD synthetase [Synechococcaceae cyanobacterium]|nr:bifunctional riboflavin kinase/FAD synthetase [Synechococcaceae cyanobacterium]